MRIAPRFSRLVSTALLRISCNFHVSRIRANAVHGAGRPKGTGPNRTAPALSITDKNLIDKALQSSVQPCRINTHQQDKPHHAYTVHQRPGQSAGHPRKQSRAAPHLHRHSLEPVFAQARGLGLLALRAVGRKPGSPRRRRGLLRVRLGRKRVQALQVPPLRLERRARRRRCLHARIARLCCRTP